MDFYQSNYEALTERRIEDWSLNLAVKLKEASWETESILGVCEVAGRNVLCAEHDGKQFQLDSLYDSEAFVDVWYRGQKIKVGYKSKAFMYGLGNGMYARKMLQELPEDGVLCIYEPTIANIGFLFRNFDYRDILTDKRLVLLVEECLNIKLNACFIDYLSYVDISVMIIQHYLNYNRLYADNYRYYMNELQIAVRAVMSTQNVVDRYGRNYFQNSVENLSYLYRSKSLHELSKRLPKGLPAIIAAAGPSLDKNVDELKNAKNKALIIAVDSSLRVLLKHGIIPDLVVSIDGVKMPAHFDYPGTQSVPLICLMNTNYNIVKKHHGMTFFTHDLNAYLQKFFETHDLLMPIVGSGGSVANTAMSIAQTMELNPIILVGQDLAYTDNKTHSLDSVRGSWGTDASKLDGIMTEGYDGNPIWSSTEFELYRLWIEEEILTKPGLRVINATEGGAKIRGAEQMTLREAIEAECSESYDMEQIVKGTPDFFDAKQKEEFVEYMHCIPEELEVCLKKVQNNKRLYQKIQEMVYGSKYRIGELQRLLAQTTEYNDYLDEALAMEYVRDLIQVESSEVLHDLHKTSDDEMEDLKIITKSMISYLETMEKGICEAKAYLEARLPVAWEDAKQELPQ